MDRKDQRHIAACGEAADGPGNRLHPFAEVLAAVAGDPDDALAGKSRLDIGQARGKLRFGLDPRNDPVQRVDHRISGDVDGRGIDILAPQRRRRSLRRRAMQRGDGADDLAVDLFGPRMVDVAAPQPRLDMADRDLAVVGGDRPGHRGGGIALHNDPVGPLLIHHPAKAGEQRRGEPVEGLVGLHQVEVMIGRDPRDLQHLVEHSAVLRADADAAVEARYLPRARGPAGTA